MADTGENQQPEQVFRKQTKNKNIRKRVVDEDGDSKTEGSSLLNQKKTSKTLGSKLYFSSRNILPDKPIFQFESSKEIQVHHDSKATETLETETDFSREKQAEEGKGNQKLYKGVNAYVDYKAGFRSEKAHGPLRASAHIRASARFDYQPDLCKDYKETGYCGYGDSCKFMHDRGDYKSGWQLENEWIEAEKERKRKLADDGLVEGRSSLGKNVSKAIWFGRRLESYVTGDGYCRKYAEKMARIIPNREEMITKHHILHQDPA